MTGTSPEKNSANMYRQLRYNYITTTCQAYGISDKVEIVWIFQPGIDPRELLVPTLSVSAVDEANLPVVGRLGRGRDELH
jgi:hypothetical protein